LRQRLLARERPDGCRDPGPELGLLRAELAHWRRSLWERG
jgi:hypothetical protein